MNQHERDKYHQTMENLKAKETTTNKPDECFLTIHVRRGTVQEIAKKLNINLDKPSSSQPLREVQFLRDAQLLRGAGADFGHAFVTLKEPKGVLPYGMYSNPRNTPVVVADGTGKGAVLVNEVQKTDDKAQPMGPSQYDYAITFKLTREQYQRAYDYMVEVNANTKDHYSVYTEGQQCASFVRKIIEIAGIDHEKAPPNSVEHFYPYSLIPLKHRNSESKGVAGTAEDPLQQLRDNKETLRILPESATEKEIPLKSPTPHNGAGVGPDGKDVPPLSSLTPEKLKKYLPPDIWAENGFAPKLEAPSQIFSIQDWKSQDSRIVSMYPSASVAAIKQGDLRDPTKVAEQVHLRMAQLLATEEGLKLELDPRRGTDLDRSV